ncbi:MAG: malto-oligosyltrehalose synthase [Candidatus Bathyarchaeota archaeon]|nr:malto-oligosyltrehalose synthase [Candidatus Bathyarchaeota archaeon]
MKAPTATYRIQLNRGFTFSDLKDILPYLKTLGISHIYASPIFQAKEGSLHGYDVTDPDSISDDLGGRAGFEEVSDAAAALGLGWLQDIVSNHASYSVQNLRIKDVFSKGAGSAYACFFDVDWNHPSAKLFGKLMAPFLPEPYRKSLQSGQIRLVNDGEFKIKAGAFELPVNLATQQHLEMDGAVEQTLEKYNSRPEFLDAILVKQHYSLSHWRTALRHINYRRFFDIIDLIGVRMENPAAFEQMQTLFFELAQSGRFSALRFDHIDGLSGPQAYLEHMRSCLPQTYLVVEKILTGQEQLPLSWPVQGTTGYDFCDRVNKLLVQNENEAAFDEIYRSFVGESEAFEEMLYREKKSIILTSFMGDARNLARLFDDSLRKSAYRKPWSRRGLLAALVEVMTCFPIYRTYIDEGHRDDAAFKDALWSARQRSPQFADGYSAVDFILKASRASPDALEAVMRFQQYSGAVMAKGFEDTALYSYSRLLSLNEVGSNPSQFGISLEEFHRFNELRRENWPLTLNATSTHDSKRGEDVRARLAVLSELPGQFQASLLLWREINAAKKLTVDGTPAPDACMEYYLYQTLLGAYPWLKSERETFTARVGMHMVKALREQKTHSSWLSPNLPYEEAVADFVRAVLPDRAFLDAFLPLQQKTACLGALNSLSQTLLKVACPGVPDFYQGSELWNLSLVDPDNRGPVNLTVAKSLLSEVAALEPTQLPGLLSDFSDGKAKLYLIYRALRFRSSQKRLFEQGTYHPLAPQGKHARHAVAFCRNQDADWAVAVVQRYPSGLLYIRGGRPAESNSESSMAWGELDWADTYIELPKSAPNELTDIFTDRTHRVHSGRLLFSDILEKFPVALLWGKSNG